MDTNYSVNIINFGPSADDGKVPHTQQKELMMKQLKEYVSSLLLNGIVQHSQQWEDAKLLTIGGSQISIIIGKNPYSSINKLIAEKIGISSFRSDVKMQWGNLFEPLIKRYVEIDKQTIVIGSDIFIPGNVPNTSYSPDGLGVVNMLYEYKVEDQMILISQNTRVLFEFKCPQSRIPTGKPPEYYIPQVKYGLDIIPCVDIGLFVEGLFRRCAWEDLGNNPIYDKTLVAKSSGTNPLAFGIIGFYYSEAEYKRLIEYYTNNPKKHQVRDIAIRKNTLKKYYTETFEVGNSSNDYMSNDLGTCDPKLFENIMHSFDLGIVRPWYPQKMNIVGDNFDAYAAVKNISEAHDEFEQFCKDNDYQNYGILPWKLFRVDYNYIERETGFIDKWKPKIDKVIDVIRECLLPENNSKKLNIYNEYVGARGGGFTE